MITHLKGRNTLIYYLKGYANIDSDRTIRREPGNESMNVEHQTKQKEEPAVLITSRSFYLLHTYVSPPRLHVE